MGNGEGPRLSYRRLDGVRHTSCRYCEKFLAMIEADWIGSPLEG